MRWFWVLFLVLGFSPTVSAECWRIPSECYAVELTTKGLAVSLEGKELGLRVLRIPRKGGDLELRCLESVVQNKLACGHYYHCRPVDHSKPNSIDTDATEALEVRWVVSGSSRLKQGEIRHAIPGLGGPPAGRWHKAEVSMRHWATISSSSPQCSLDTKEQRR